MGDKSSTVGVGVMGAGFMGKAHSNAYKTIPYMFWPRTFNHEMVAVAATSQKKAEDAAERYGYAKAYEGFEKLAADPDITVFDNCSPDQMHYLPTISAIMNGKHVLCEKPLAMDPAQAKEMYETAEKQCVLHMVCHNYRFFPAVRFAFELIKEGALGDICHFRGSYTQHFGRGANMPLKSGESEYGGVAHIIGSHVIDMSRMLVGEVASVSGLSKTYIQQRRSISGETVKSGLEDGITALVEFENGATGVYEAINTIAGRVNRFEWQVYGTKGSMDWNLETPDFLKVYTDDIIDKRVAGFAEVLVNNGSAGHPYTEVWWPNGHNLGWEHGHINAIHHFLDCVANGKPVAPYGATFYDGYRIEMIIEAMRRSSKEGKRISVGCE